MYNYTEKLKTCKIHLKGKANISCKPTDILDIKIYTM